MTETTAKILTAIGAGLVTAGVALLHIPSAFVVLGVFLVALGLIASW